MRNPFTLHPAEVGETYGQHLVKALSFGLRLILAGTACLVHALLPFACVSTGSRMVGELNDEMSRRRRHGPAGRGDAR